MRRQTFNKGRRKESLRKRKRTERTTQNKKLGPPILGERPLSKINKKKKEKKKKKKKKISAIQYGGGRDGSQRLERIDHAHARQNVLSGRG